MEAGREERKERGRNGGRKLLTDRQRVVGVLRAFSRYAHLKKEEEEEEKEEEEEEERERERERGGGVGGNRDRQRQINRERQTES